MIEDLRYFPDEFWNPTRRLHQSDKLRSVCHALWSDKPKLCEMSAQRHGNVRALPDQQISGSMKHYEGLLILGFDRDKPHCWSRYSLANSFRIGSISLISFDEWLDVLRRQQSDVVTES